MGRGCRASLCESRVPNAVDSTCGQQYLFAAQPVVQTAPTAHPEEKRDCAEHQSTPSLNSSHLISVSVSPIPTHSRAQSPLCFVYDMSNQPVPCFYPIEHYIHFLSDYISVTSRTHQRPPHNSPCHNTCIQADFFSIVSPEDWEGLCVEWKADSSAGIKAFLMVEESKGEEESFPLLVTDPKVRPTETLSHS